MFLLCFSSFVACSSLTNKEEVNMVDQHFNISTYQGVHCCTKIATSTLISAPLKAVTIKCIEHDVTCLNERVLVKTMYNLLTNCSQSILPAMACRLSLLVLKYKLSKVWRIMLCNPMKALLNQGCLNQWSFTLASQRPVIGWKHFGGLWPLSHFYRELISGCIMHCKGSDTTWELMMHFNSCVPSH